MYPSLLITFGLLRIAPLPNLGKLIPRHCSRRFGINTGIRSDRVTAIFTGDFILQDPHAAAATAKAQAEATDFGIPVDPIGLATAGKVGFDPPQVGVGELDAVHDPCPLGSVWEVYL